MLIELGIQATYFGFGLCLLQAVERVLESRKVRSWSLMFYIFNGIILLATGLIADGVARDHPGALFLFVSSIFIVGPLNLFYYHTLLYPGRKAPFRVWLHLAPFLAGLCLELLFQLQPEPFRRELIVTFFANPLRHALIIPLAVAALHVLAYMLFILKVFLLEPGFKRTQREYRFIGSVAAAVLLVTGLLFGGFAAKSPGIFVTGCVVNVFIHVCLFLAMRLFPQFFDSLKAEIRKKRYEKSMLRGVDTALARERLREMMEDERIYRDSEITLASLAGRLSLTPHQLSELLNEQLGVGFRDFIARYRITEAREILEAAGDANITAVCYRVGFNSKSSFNAAFRKFTGTTPTELRLRKNGKIS